MTVAEANLKARELARWRRKKFFAMSQNDQAKEIGCSWGTWSKTPFYKECKKQGKIKPGKHPKGSRPPSVVSLTAKMEEVVGDGDKNQVLEEVADKETLEDLIAEQQAEREPSPLEEDPRVKSPGGSTGGDSARDTPAGVSTFGRFVSAYKAQLPVKSTSYVITPISGSFGCKGQRAPHPRSHLCLPFPQHHASSHRG
jgi:hypothetical protein